MRIQVIIADDHQIVREGLKALFEMEPDIQVVAEAEDGCKTLTLVREFTPHVVLMDIKMPVLDGIEATRQILVEFPTIKVIGLSMYGDQHYVTKMLEAGAHGYLLKDCAFEELVEAIRLVFSGKIYLSPEIAGIVVRALYSRPSHFAFSILTARQLEVVQLMAEGKTASQVADLLDISAKTVHTYRGQIKRKLGIGGVAELTRYALREGLTSLEI